MADNKLQNSQRKSFTQYLQDQVVNSISDMQGFVTTSEAKRLTLNIAVAAQKAIDDSKKGFEFNQGSYTRFLTETIKTVTAGLDAANDEVYVYPYGQEMSVTPSYKGYLKMIKEHSIGKKIEDMLVFVVREGEKFAVNYGTQDDEWVYESVAFNSAPPVGYVTVIVYEDGTSRVMEHTLDDIEKRRKANPQGTSPAWKNWPVEMGKAKAIKRHAKTVNIRLEAKEFYLDNDDFVSEEEPFKDVTPPTLELPQMTTVPKKEPQVVEVEAKQIEEPEPPEVSEAKDVTEAGDQVSLDWMEA